MRGDPGLKRNPRTQTVERDEGSKSGMVWSEKDSLVPKGHVKCVLRESSRSVGPTHFSPWGGRRYKSSSTDLDYGDHRIPG